MKHLRIAAAASLSVLCLGGCAQKLVVRDLIRHQPFRLEACSRALGPMVARPETAVAIADAIRKEHPDGRVGDHWEVLDNGESWTVFRNSPPPPCPHHMFCVMAGGGGLSVKIDKCTGEAEALYQR